MTWSNDKIFRNPRTGLFERIANRAEAPADGIGQPNNLPPDTSGAPFPVAERGGGFADARAFNPVVGVDSDGSGSGPVLAVDSILEAGQGVKGAQVLDYAPRPLPGVPKG